MYKYGLFVCLLFLFIGCGGSGGGGSNGGDNPDNKEPTITSFSASSELLVATFAWNVSDEDGDTLSCTLDVDGDGTTDYPIADCASTTTQVHTYETEGTFTAKLTVSDSKGGEASDTTSVAVSTTPNNPPSISRFEVSSESGAVPLTVTFSWRISEFDDGDTLVCELDSDSNGTIDSGPVDPCDEEGTLSYTYTKEGDYQAKLIVTDSRGAKVESESVSVEAIEPTTLTVNTAEDTIDQQPGNNVCADDNGQCSLRAAVMEANKSSGPERINVPAGTYNLTSVVIGSDTDQVGDLDIEDDVVIVGAGQDATIIDGQALHRLFEVESDVSLTLEALTLQNGNADNENGGAINAAFRSNLVLTNVKIDNNSGNSGAGIYTSSTMEIRKSTISNNESSRAFSNGGGINAETANIVDSVISSNKAGEAGRGGGVSVNTLALVQSTVANNQASSGGGISAVTLDIETSTISNNQSSSETNPTGSNGGGLHVRNSAKIKNSTISANTATGSGGGIYFGSFLSSEPNIQFSTVANNTAAIAGGIFFGDEDEVELKGLLLGNNSATESGPQCVGKPVSRGYNLIESVVGCDFGSISGDEVGNPNLSGLANNGGSTQTQLPNAGSPVLNKIPADACTFLDTSKVETDQRDISRPQNGACDIGAVELE